MSLNFNGSSTALRPEIDPTNELDGPNYQPHHLIPAATVYSSTDLKIQGVAAQTRNFNIDVLEQAEDDWTRFTFDIADARNGIMLPAIDALAEATGLDLKV